MQKPVVEPVICFQPDGVEIPSGIDSFERFRAWMSSEPFPDRGRIDWLSGRLEVDRSPEDLFTHGTPKSAIATRLGALLQDKEKGLVFIDKTRLSCPRASLSAEPDVLVILDESLREGLVKLVAGASGAEGRYVEVEDPADLVVECVSDSSVVKDTERLRSAYHKAGVREYWIVDARGPGVSFQILLHRPEGYAPSPSSADGHAVSQVLGLELELVRTQKASGAVYFRLEAREPGGPRGARGPGGAGGPGGAR